MTETIIIASTATYYRARGSNAIFLTARGVCTGISNNGKVGMEWDGTTYFVERLGFKFISTIPSGDIVSKVQMRLVATGDSSATDFDLQICEQPWSAQDPIAAGNQEAFYDGCLAETDYFTWRNTSGISLNTQYTGPEMNIPYFNVVGNTYYSLRSSLDYSNTTPTTIDFLTMGLPDNATEGYKPALIVTHAAPSGNTQGLLALF